MAAKKGRGLNALRKASSDSSKTKTQTTPRIPAPAEIEESVLDWLKAKDDIESAKGRLEVAEGSMEDICQNIRIARCRQDREIYASIRLTDKEGDSVMFQQQGRFTKMKESEDEDRLKAEFRQDFDQFFQIEESFELDASELTEEMADKIADALGPDIDKILTPRREVIPTKAFVNAIVLDPKVTKKWEVVRADGLCVPYKASFKR